MKSKTSSPKRRPDGAIKALAEALEVTTRRTHALLSEGMPDDIPGALTWRASRENTDSAEQLRIEKIKLTRTSRELKEAELARVRGESVSRAEVTEMFTALGSAIGAFCERASREIPQETLGLPIERGLPKSRAKMRELQTLFCDRRSEFWAKHPAKDDEPANSKPKRKKP